MIALGVDPGVRRVALALCNETRLLRVSIHTADKDGDTKNNHIRMMRTVTQAFNEMAERADVIVVESQEIYTGGLTPNFNDMVRLAQVAGSIVAYAHVSNTAAAIYVPLPKEWKGQQPKEINQGRTLNHFGIQFAEAKIKEPYCYPTGCAKVAQVKGWGQTHRGDWEHIGDAAGLARWGIEHHVKELRKRP